jgi:hypothetical protein
MPLNATEPASSGKSSWNRRLRRTARQSEMNLNSGGSPQPHELWFSGVYTSGTDHRRIQSRSNVGHPSLNNAILTITDRGGFHAGS